MTDSEKAEAKRKDNEATAGILQQFLADRGLYTGPHDKWAGPSTRLALRQHLAKEGYTIPTPKILEAPGFNFKLEVVGADLVIRNARATCFGGSNDPQDSGDTASGISTKPIGTLGVALPRNYTGSHVPTRIALQGSPIPESLPFKTMVEFTSGGKTYAFPFIDIGPAKRTGNALDLTVAAARKYDPRATATRFEAFGDVRIIGGAKYI